MNGATREQIMAALAARLATANAFTAVSRRMRDPENVASGTLTLVKARTRYEPTAPNLPPRRFIDALAIVHVDVGDNENAIPESVMNPLEDAVDAALKPDVPGTAFCTLGGLVEHCICSGVAEHAPGDITGRGIAIIPIEILVP